MYWFVKEWDLKHADEQEQQKYICVSVYRWNEETLHFPSWIHYNGVVPCTQNKV